MVKDKAISFARKHQIVEKITYLLNESGREMQPLPVVAGSGYKGSGNQRLMHRQYPIPGTGIMLVQESGPTARGILINLALPNESDTIVFQYMDKQIQRFRMGHWLYALQAEYERVMNLNQNMQSREFIDKFSPLKDNGDPFDAYDNFIEGR